MITLEHKIFLLLLYNYSFATIINHNINTCFLMVLENHCSTAYWECKWVRLFGWSLRLACLSPWVSYCIGLVVYILLHIHLSVLLVTCPQTMLIPQMHLTFFFLSYERGQLCGWYCHCHSFKSWDYVNQCPSLTCLTGKLKYWRRKVRTPQTRLFCPICIFSERHTRKRWFICFNKVC